jgi:hypothetical protein
MRCDHTKADSWWEVDGRGIPLARVCEKCCDAVLATYRPDIFGAYNEADVDEPIEDDKW